MPKNLLPARTVGKHLDVNRLGEWMDAVLVRISGEYGATNFDLMWALGQTMAFPSFLMPENDDIADCRGAGDHPPCPQG